MTLWLNGCQGHNKGITTKGNEPFASFYSSRELIIATPPSPTISSGYKLAQSSM